MVKYWEPSILNRTAPLLMGYVTSNQLSILQEELDTLFDIGLITTVVLEDLNIAVIVGKPLPKEERLEKIKQLEENA